MSTAISTVRPLSFACIPSFLGSCFRPGAGALVLILGMIAGLQAQTIGPVYPPPAPYGAVTLVQTGDLVNSEPAIWTFSNIDLANAAVTYWGPAPNHIIKGYNLTPYAFTSANSNTAYYSGPSIGFADTPLYQTRFHVTYTSGSTVSLVAAGSVGIDPSVGVVLVVTPGMTFTATMEFEKSANGGTTWTPFLSNTFDGDPDKGPGLDGQLRTDFLAGFYYSNMAPTVGVIPDQTVTIVGSPPQALPVGPIDFTISDYGDVNEVVLGNAGSTLPSVVDPASVVLSNNNGAATISFTALPQAPNTTATTTVSFTATDGFGAQTVDSFNVTVNGDTAPTIGNVSPTSMVMQENATSGQVTFVVGDNQTPPNNLIVTASSDTPSVIANNNISVTAPDGSGNASATVTSTGTPGSATITLSVSDGQENATATFMVRVNAPPVYNGPTDSFQVTQGGSGTIATAMLSGTDPDTSSPVTFLVEGQTHAGTLYLNGVASPSSFTQTDIDTNKLTYTQDGSCQNGDNFQFEIEDVDEGFANDPSQGPGPTTYSFPINISFTQTAPTANAGSLSVPIGGSVPGTLTASSTDCGPPAITYQLATPPVHGNVVGPDPNTGAFTYTANGGFAGSDSFTFTATTYGTMVSAPATVGITIQDQAPVAQASSLTTHENDAATGTLVATDADLPPQTLTYAIATAPTLGTVMITNATTGAYTYTPNHNLFGADSFTFTASDGLLTSTPATVSVQIRPYLKTGEVLVTDQGDHHTIATSVVLFDPVSAQQATFSQDAQYGNLEGIAVEADGHVLVGNVGNGNSTSVFRIDPLTGTPTLLVATGVLHAATGMAVEANGDILVADPNQGVLRFDPATGAQIGTTIVLGTGAAPSNVAVAADTTLWVTDVGAEFSNPHAADDKLWHVNADGTNPVIVTHGGNLALPIGLALGTSGDAYVSNAIALFGSGTSAVVHVDSGGNQTIVTQDGDIDAATSLALTSAGQLYVISNKDASVIGVDPGTGTQTPLTVGGLLTAPWALEIVPALPGVDLSVTVSTNLAYLPGGKSAQYTVVVRNNGNQTATAATISNTTTLPANLSAAGWTCQATGGGSCTASGTGAFSDTLTVPVGATVTYVVTVNVAKLPETPTTFSVTVKPTADVTDADNSNNTATTTDMVKIFAGDFE
jgi:hypothetical protein